jgi:hypothetical protein
MFVQVKYVCSIYLCPTIMGLVTAAFKYSVNCFSHVMARCVICIVVSNGENSCHSLILHSVLKLNDFVLLKLICLATSTVTITHLWY